MGLATNSFVCSGCDQHDETAKSKTNVETDFLNVGEEDEMTITGYELSSAKNALTVSFYFLTLGLLRLIFHWYPHWMLICTHRKCPLAVASKVLITDSYKGTFKTHFVKEVRVLSPNRGDNHHQQRQTLDFRLGKGSRKETCETRAIWCKKLCYAWDPQEGHFAKLCGLEVGTKNSELRNCEGLSENQQENRRIIYGANEIQVPVKTVLTLLVLEALTPFYIFQVFSLIVWFCEYYYYYTIAIIVMSVFGIGSSVIQTRKNQENLRGTVQSVDKVTVRRMGGAFEEIPTDRLVPGDVIAVPMHGCVMQCDAVLLNGSCIVNESMLTGESVPVTKTPLPATDALYDMKEDCNHTLFCGTKVIQTRFYGEENVLAVVLRTGFLTSKGQLVKSIMYPPPADFKFDQDSYKFIAILSFIAILGVIYTVVSKSTRDISPLDILIKSLDLITIAIPPALPAAMTVGKLYALGRLKRNNIYCINSRVINVSGSINCVCFDKTGTLTEDGLDMRGVVPAVEGDLLELVKDVKELPINSDLVQAMATCHSLTLIDGEIAGDPLDVKVFESTGWSLEEPEVPDTAKYDLLVPKIARSPDLRSSAELGIVHQFQFSSKLQRMSVVARRLGSDHFEVFCKGSPEMLIGLSRPDSVPKDVLRKLIEFTGKGYRVLGIGSRALESEVTYSRLQKMRREEVERDLNFLGLVILENRLKGNTASVIATLKEAGMKIVMITGDNIQTALSVAKECGIIAADQTVVDVSTTQEEKLEGSSSIKYTVIGNGERHPSVNGDAESGGVRPGDFCFTLSGVSWAAIRRSHPDAVPGILARGSVFARTSSDQKQQLVEELQGLGYYVAMCGDGANDCGALKAAHVGVSLSEAESSVASPFTSKDASIESVTKIVREGRAALVTSFGVFKFMVCYSLTELTSTIILYGIDSNLTSMQFLFIDIFLILNFAFFFGMTEASEGPLAKKPPMTSLLGFVPLASINLNMVVSVAFQVAAYHVVKIYSWYQPFIFDPQNNTFFSCYENTAVFTISTFQYITAAVAFSKGQPYRKPIFTNIALTSSVAVTIACCVYITLYPARWITDLLEIKQPPALDGPASILLLTSANFLLSLLVEDVLVERLIGEKLRNYLRKPFFSGRRREGSSRKKYLSAEKQLTSDCGFLDLRGGDVICRHEREVSKNGRRCHANEAFEVEQ